MNALHSITPPRFHLAIPLFVVASLLTGAFISRLNQPQIQEAKPTEKIQHQIKIPIRIEPKPVKSSKETPPKKPLADVKTKPIDANPVKPSKKDATDSKPFVDKTPAAGVNGKTATVDKTPMAKSVVHQTHPETSPVKEIKTRPDLPLSSERANVLPLSQIDAEQNEIANVPLRVFVPTHPAMLESHLKASGGCLAVSRINGPYAEVLSVYHLSRGKVQRTEQLCSGIPRILRSLTLNATIGDPIGEMKAKHLAMGNDLENLVLQVILTPTLQSVAQSTLKKIFGDLSDTEMAAQARRIGYQLQCYALKEGGVSCQ